MKLYYATGTCALASHIALEEAGAEYSTVRISFADEEQRKKHKHNHAGRYAGPQHPYFGLRAHQKACPRPI